MSGKYEAHNRGRRVRLGRRGRCHLHRHSSRWSGHRHCRCAGRWRGDAGERGPIHVRNRLVRLATARRPDRNLPARVDRRHRARVVASAVGRSAGSTRECTPGCRRGQETPDRHVRRCAPARLGDAVHPCAHRIPLHPSHRLGHRGVAIRRRRSVGGQRDRCDVTRCR